MWRTRVVIPKVHPQKIQEELHGGHLGVGKMEAIGTFTCVVSSH